MTKFVIVSTHARDNLERATLAWVMANAALTLDAEVLVFLQGSAVNVARKDYVKGWVFPPFAPLEELIQNFIKSGGKLFVCDPCLKARMVEKNKLIKEAQIAAAVTLLTESIDATVYTY